MSYHRPDARQWLDGHIKERMQTDEAGDDVPPLQFAAERMHRAIQKAAALALRPACQHGAGITVGTRRVVKRSPLTHDERIDRAHNQRYQEPATVLLRDERVGLSALVS